MRADIADHDVLWSERLPQVGDDRLGLEWRVVVDPLRRRHTSDPSTVLAGTDALGQPVQRIVKLADDFDVRLVVAGELRRGGGDWDVLLFVLGLPSAAR